MLRSALKLLRATVLAASALALPGIAAAQQPLQIEVSKGNMEPLPIAIADFGASSGGEAGVSMEISKVIRDNLNRSGLFRSLDPASFIQRSPDVAAPPKFADWRVINSKALVTGKTSLESDGRLRVEFRLWDIFAEQQMIGLQFFTTPENARRVGHMISDAIYERLTGEKGYFDTRIVYVAESGPKVRKVKRLAIMDQDGANQQFLTDGRSLVVTPRFSPSAQAISFMSYQGKSPRVYIFDLETGREEVLQGFNGMTFSPRFSPDGNKVIMSMARDGNTDLYLVDLRSRATQRLTTDPGIDTGGSFSPDGTQIVFESDRGGTQQIYVMGADGSNPRRVSFGQGRYATPVWSPRGDAIAFTKMLGGTFGIGVMRPDGSGERRLTESFLDEGPTWAPNGRVIMFARQSPGGPSSIWSVDLTGQNLRRVPTPGEASDPAWSPDLDGPGIN
jgi:TolB protein